MSYKDSLKLCRKIGTAHATGDSLRAMYANLIAGSHGGAAEKYFQHLQTTNGNDDQITETSRELLRNRAKAWDVFIGL